MAGEAPKDKFKAVWLILFMLGLGTLLPWNFFMTATMYFNHRLADLTPANVTVEESRNALQAKFNNAMTLCAMIPLLIFTCLTSILHQRIPQKIRILGSLVAILVVFCVTALFVKLAVNPVAFFVITMIKIIIINAFGAILQGSLFGMAGVLPDGYTTPVMSGQGLAGTFAALAMILAIASGSDLMDCAFGYFITACIVITLATVSYIILPNLEFYRYYMEKNQKDPALEEEKKIQLIKNGDSSGGMSTGGEVRKNLSLLSIFKKIWVMALSVCFSFTVTICTFPAIAVDITSTIADGGLWEKYFIPVSCFLLFNLFDWSGRSLTAVCSWPGKDSKLLPALLLTRLIFIPLFMLCNVQPRYRMPVIFSHDAWFIIFIILFAFSSGYLSSLCMCFYSKLVDTHEVETAGAIMTFFMSLGLALGASFSFFFRWLI
ncbi:equilibrative nucleoside transporter 1 isoform X1 [Hemibagrus wyckioides]|uniref:equilibrative nucleoside transporter 1 isoform X1 n=1 Tax=Hemibagrus wyckioides TaxID=337641 RepID=UPI00266BDF73|nr:equilibrative nucleoside transporter 1 isoform X1 [Hemibagrus wyckioides]XP_058256537.1 equilibrative nucleoside transporter 1 isoform X1 [Hemibagrus wyckioides]XP_058256538.1 equilibrative nucleoside transporter 1 isoform X1 [Hemibagrus wyckioides]XP_058256539.1 equilibrative nucleoside transporter 1 isoform X1 [Hemibagrus wyckioides]